MINRRNYEDVEEFLLYLKDVKRVDADTVKNYRVKLKHLLVWAGNTPLAKSKGIREPLPVYLEGLKSPKGRPLAASSLTGLMTSIQVFFTWMKKMHPSRYRPVDPLWIEGLRPSRDRRMESELVERELFSLEDVRKMMAAPAENAQERRTRAAVAFLFLSGMRIGAFVTLPVECVDLARGQVYQLPAKGVRTKNRKAAVTFLLEIPDLLSVCKEWDQEVRSAGGLWYSALDTAGKRFIQTSRAGRSSGRSDFCKYLRELCNRAGVKYHSPHKLRHGHAVFALKHARDMKDLKAISENLMHSTVGITDGIYGRLVEDDRRNLIRGLRE